MIIDFDEVDDGFVFEADICVIGSGAAGFTIAREFFHDAHSVLILEGGGKAPDAAIDDLYRSEIAGLPHKGIHTGRARVLGGTTTLWAGQTLPLEPLDFEYRPWVPDSGWPIRRADLEKYYRRAEETLNVKPIAYDASQWPYRIQMLPFDKNLLVPSISQFSPAPNFALAYGNAVAQARSIRLVLHANAVSLQASPAGTALEKVQIRSLSGKRGWAKARYFVICCGGIETPRLLLASNDVQRNGLGNERDLVGRYFQDHVQASVVPIRGGNLRKLRASLHPFVWRGITYGPRVGISPAVQEKREILNATVGLSYDQFVSPDSPVESAKRIVRGIRHNRWDFPFGKNLLNVMRGPHEVVSAAFRRAVLKRPAFQMSGTPHVAIQCECDPNPASRVSLSEECDALGTPRAKLDWRVSRLVKDTIIAGVEIFAGEVARMGLGHLDADKDQIRATVSEWGSQFFDANHHIGTTRMSEDESRGVVDPNCRVHSVQNLFIASSSVFPTSGHSNPTFTILALGIRLADHLKALLAK